jgi:hypothetical protein
VGFVETGAMWRCGGLGVRLLGSDKSDRPSGGTARTGRGQCVVSIIIMIVSKKKI